MDTMTMKNWSFLRYWLYAAFPHCYGLHNYLLWKISCPCEKVMGQESVPVCQTVHVDNQKITILLYRYHVEYRCGERELYQPCLPYHVVENLDNDTFFLLLPIVDLAECEYDSSNVVPDLIRRLSETELPEEHVKEVAYSLGVGLAEADGAEDEPLWIIWQETQKHLYGAQWWADAKELWFFQQDMDGKYEPAGKYLLAPEGVDVFSWGKAMLSQWIDWLE